MPEFYYKVVSSDSGEFTSKTRTAKDADKGNTDWNETVALVVYEPDLESLEVNTVFIFYYHVTYEYLCENLLKP